MMQVLFSGPREIRRNIARALQLSPQLPGYLDPHGGGRSGSASEAVGLLTAALDDQDRDLFLRTPSEIDAPVGLAPNEIATLAEIAKDTVKEGSLDPYHAFIELLLDDVARERLQLPEPVITALKDFVLAISPDREKTQMCLNFDKP